MTPCEAQQRKAAFRDLELYGWSFVCSLTDEQFAAACNGCGPASWTEEWRARLSKWLSTFGPAFDGHDCRFTFDNDGSREKFDYANDELEKNCLLLADLKYSWYNPIRYFARNRAHLVATACRLFGWSDWKKAYTKKHNKENT